ncbi:MAG: Gfo/Idh/MocA family oxidoreductase [Cytophagaceae bacterium]|nr:Gfo/Idh/MocA family oxidoreductase [Cytophagaceae bacterium]
MSASRRSFLKKLGGSAAALTTGSALIQEAQANAQIRQIQSTIRPFGANDQVNIALIGAGIIGHYDTSTALKVPGTQLVAVCDLYDGRLTRAKEVWGDQLFTTRDYREILARKDVDAVLICVPDHWHDHISIAALNAGKHVYCEKPMVHRIAEGQAVIEAQKRAGKVFQVGSQRASSAGILAAKKYYEDGAIGELTFVEAYTDRSNAMGAWQYSIPPDASPQTVDWDRFQGDAPKHPFDATRFFRWRNYKDYGTGVAGDLFVHLLTGLHVITGSLGPQRIFSLADLNYWKDGRDAYDLVTGILDYPQTDKHPSFQFVTRVNLSDGSGGGQATKLVGTEGVIELGWNDFTLKRFKRPIAPGYGGYDSYNSFPKAIQEQFAKEYEARYAPETRKGTKEPDVVFKAPEGYDDRLDHLTVFFNAIRENNPALITEDASFGLRAAAPSLACNLSAELRQVVNWDPVKMRIVEPAAAKAKPKGTPKPGAKAQKSVAKA